MIYFPAALNMTPKSPSQYQKKVIGNCRSHPRPKVNTIYEAVFQYDDVLIMLDILVRDGDSWKAFEVKSSRGRISATYLTDAATAILLVLDVLNCQYLQRDYVNKDYVLKRTEPAHIYG